MLSILPQKPLPQISPSEDEGEIIEIIRPNYWRVSYGTTHWFARSGHGVTFNIGDFVHVVGRLNTTTLLVEPY